MSGNAKQSPDADRLAILHAVHELQGEGHSYVSDSAIAAYLMMDLQAVRGHLEILHGEGRATLAESMGRHSAYLTPGQRQLAEEAGMVTPQSDPGSPDPGKVFVVHGRNLQARDAVYTFLRALRLRPLEWSEVVKATGKASPYIGEVLEKGFSMVQTVVVLLTPDDEASPDSHGGSGS